MDGAGGLGEPAEVALGEEHAEGEQESGQPRGEASSSYRALTIVTMGGT